ncbi:MAG TPA: histidine--tRNA ligase [bacterium]|nr:histidine--tRNA ligase [bacterium]HPR87004.1 histidine--tRNA ligase [bacterium]
MELSLKGFRDLLPADMIARDRMVALIKEVYESYGFVPIATPALEYKRVLLAYSDATAELTRDEFDRLLLEFPQARAVLLPLLREENGIIRIRVSDLSVQQQTALGSACLERIVSRVMADKQVYLFQEPEGHTVGLRFDLTVPLSRFVADHPELPRPFKRYQFQPVWRYDKPDPGRFREFSQFDIDTVGSDSLLADTEIIAAMHECLTRLGLNYRIRYSSRKLLNGLLAYAGIAAERAHALFRVIDKLEKQGLDNVKKELGPGRIDASGDPIPGLHLHEEQIARIIRFLSISESTRVATLATLNTLFQGVDAASEGLRELEEIHHYLEAMGIPDSQVVIDPTIARGLDYYTGPIFEAILIDEQLGSFGSVMGGGRYDRLIGKFLGEEIPATGASIGVDRLLSALQKIGSVPARPSTAEVLVTIMDRERLMDYQRIATELRAAGIKTELYMGKEKGLGKQLKYADLQMIPVAVICGSDEFAAGQVSIKDLRAMRAEPEIKDRGEWVKKKVGQVTVSRATMVGEIRSMLA